MTFINIIYSTILSLILLLAGSNVQPDEPQQQSAVITGKVMVKTDKKTRKIKNAWVFLKGIPKRMYQKDKAMMDQTSRTYKPHVLPVLKGQTVVFKNSDMVFHTVWLKWASSGKTIINKPTPVGQRFTYTFKKPGVISVKCGPHPDMQAYIPVLNAPFLKTNTGSNGNFTVSSKRPLPKGTYTIQAWHENYGWSSAEKIHIPREKKSITLLIDTSRKTAMKLYK